MSATFIFLAILFGLVILFTAIITLCAISFSSESPDKTLHKISNQKTNPTLHKERRRICRKDFPFICNDGSCAWSDRRKVSA